MNFKEQLNWKIQFYQNEIELHRKELADLSGEYRKNKLKLIEYDKGFLAGLMAAKDMMEEMIG